MNQQDAEYGPRAHCAVCGYAHRTAAQLQGRRALPQNVQTDAGTRKEPYTSGVIDGAQGFEPESKSIGQCPQYRIGYAHGVANPWPNAKAQGCTWSVRAANLNRKYGTHIV